MSRRIIRPTIRWPATALFPLAEPRGSVCDRRDESMRVVRTALAVVALLLVARAAAYLVYVYEGLPSPAEVGDLESKLVHLAWRVQAGVRLYPTWTDYPHVTNFFGPCYFLVVGLIGSAVGAGLEGLFVIGRAVTVACALATALVLGWFVRRGHGLGAGVAAATASLGAAPMIGAGLMVRPDTMAELLGVAGFFLSTGVTARSRVAGIVLLVAAILTKQTAACFLVAASLSLFIAGRRRESAALLTLGVLALGAVVAAVSAFEPMFASSLLGEGKTPWSLANWAAELRELVVSAPDLFVVPVLGSWLWLSARPRQTTPIVLWLMVLGSGLVTAAKEGSGLNYFLSLRLVEALAIGALWTAARMPEALQRRRLAGASILAALSLVPGTILAAGHAGQARAEARFYDGPDGRRLLLARRQLFRLAEDPRVELLTDSGLLQLHQKERAAFVDPFQFRLLVETGQVRPDVILRGIRDETYDMVITTTDLYRPEYRLNIAGLPEVLAQAVREHYIPADRPLGLFRNIPRSSRREVSGRPVRKPGPRRP
jgi:hypothetical protein